MPFLDRLELAALTGWSRGAVYDAVSRLEERGMVEAVPHASPLVPPTRRHALTAAGVERLAELDGKPVEEPLFLLPVSKQWRRGLLERLDAVAVIYRLASAINQVHHPLAFRWYRAMPLDAAIVTARRQERWPWCARAIPPTAPPSPSVSGGWGS